MSSNCLRPNFFCIDSDFFRDFPVQLLENIVAFLYSVLGYESTSTNNKWKKEFIENFPDYQNISENTCLISIQFENKLTNVINRNLTKNLIYDDLALCSLEIRPHGSSLEGSDPRELAPGFEACQMKGTHIRTSELTLFKSYEIGLLRIRPLCF